MKIKQIVIFFLIAGFAAACKKAYDIPLATAPITYLNVINSTQNTINYYLNGTRQNTASSIYPSGATGYLNVTSGTQNFEFRPNGSATILFNKQLTLKDNTYQTLYVTGTTADKAFLLPDTIITSTTGANVRFVHTADGAGPLTITINDTLAFSNKSYKTVSAFKIITTGIKTLKVYAGSATVPGATQKITLSLGNNYTLYANGLPGGVGLSALTVGYFVNR